MLYQVTFNPSIANNVLEAFKEIHKRKVYHGDVRPENILVRPDDSVVIVDFERSIIDAEDKLLVEEMEEVGQIVQSWS
jgi:serine/threonine protein kinase